MRACLAPSAAEGENVCDENNPRSRALKSLPVARYHPPQGERRTVTNIEFVASWVDTGRLQLLKKEFDKARDTLNQVWRPRTLEPQPETLGC